jgi:mannosyltransferase OCH1-like enzyme
MIPKVIYQTWKTKNLPLTCIDVKNNIQKLNPEYKILLYDDQDIDNFIKSNFDEYTYNSYLQLNIGASKADFWRYCILYKYGGIYLDIDSNIRRPLNELIQEDDQCIITREESGGHFVQWFMIFEKNHPILLDTINKCCKNIRNKTTNDIIYLTGPGAFTESINQIMKPLYNKNIKNLYFEEDTNLNFILNRKSNSIKCRFYGVDMKTFGQFKHDYINDLYKDHIYWRDEKPTFDEKSTVTNTRNYRKFYFCILLVLLIFLLIGVLIYVCFKSLKK